MLVACWKSSRFHVVVVLCSTLDELRSCAVILNLIFAFSYKCGHEQNTIVMEEDWSSEMPSWRGIEAVKASDTIITWRHTAARWRHDDVIGLSRLVLKGRVRYRRQTVLMLSLSYLLSQVTTLSLLNSTQPIRCCGVIIEGRS